MTVPYTQFQSHWLICAKWLILSKIVTAIAAAGRHVRAHAITLKVLCLYLSSLLRKYASTYVRKYSTRST